MINDCNKVIILACKHDMSANFEGICKAINKHYLARNEGIDAYYLFLAKIVSKYYDFNVYDFLCKIESPHYWGYSEKRKCVMALLDVIKHREMKEPYKNLDIRK